MKEFDLLTWTPEMVKRFWDYEANFPKNYFTHNRGFAIIRQIRNYLPEHGAVLDYGCGPGNLIGPLLDAGFKVAGLDSSESARNTIVSRYGDNPGFMGAFEQSDINGSGLQFDVIIVAEVIEHLYDEQLDSLLQTLTSLSKPETHIVFTTPNEEKLEDSYILCPVSGTLFHRWQHVRNWSEASVREYLKQRNFTDTQTFTTDFDATLAIHGKHHPFRARWWSALRERWKYLTRPESKHPHMVIITRPNL